MTHSTTSGSATSRPATFVATSAVRTAWGAVAIVLAAVVAFAAACAGTA